MTNRKFWFWFCALAATANIAYGSVVAARATEPMHALLHFAVGAAFGIAAVFIRPRQHASQAALPRHDEEVLRLHESMSDLERELLETRQRLEFTDQLLQHQQKRQDQTPE